MDGADLLSFLCAAVAALGNAVANVMQRRASLEQDPGHEFGVRVLARLIRRKTWLLGFSGMVASFVLQAVALSLGQLSAVEPIITLEVPLTMLVAGHVFAAPLGRLEWSAIFAMTAGMIALVASLESRSPATSRTSATSPTSLRERRRPRRSVPSSWPASGADGPGEPPASARPRAPASASPRR